MKKKFIIIPSLAIFIIIAVCFAVFTSNSKKQGGSTQGVVKVIGDSEYFSKDDINAAMDAYIDGWQRDPECAKRTLTKVSYDDKTYEDRFNSHGQKDKIVLHTSYDTASDIEDGFNPNFSYTGDTAIVSRSFFGRWTYTSWGGFY